MSDLPISGNFSDTEEDVVEDEDEELRFQESIKKDLFTEFSSATPMKMSRVSVAHNREPMKVYLRVRPFTNIEVEEGESQECMDQENNTTLLMRAPKNSFAFKSSQRGFGEMNHKFTFSKIFDEDTCQKVFFDETMLATVKEFIDGHNCLVFTYGVTNAGKTYTIQGVPQDGGILPRSLDVIFNSIEDRQFFSYRLKPRYFCDVVKLSEKQQKKEQDIKSSVLALCSLPSTSAADQTTMLEGESMTDDSLNTDVSHASYSAHNDDSQDSSKLSESKMSTTKDFEAMSNQTFLDEVNARIPDDTEVNVDAQGPIKFSIWVSFAEIYNEYMYDLLEPLPKEKKIRRQALKLAEDKNGSIYIKGLKQIPVSSADEAYRVLKIGQRNLSIAATKLNHCSSRSHCIFSIKILRVVAVDDPHVARVSHLSFCDLAGSERYTRTQNTGDRLKEAGNINTSLLTLGKCIHALRYNQNHPKSHPKIIPFRESKLTRLFQSFFLGKGKASMVVNVNQCASGFDETMHVLKFSAIAKQVTTVTSKLDNKWKEPPPKKSKRPLRNVSLALNQALDCRVKGQRPSVPWATPGTIAQVMKETGHVTSMEDTVFEVDEEEEEEEEEDLESDMADTPVAKKDENVSKFQQIQKELLAVIEVLKQKLVDEKAEKFFLETKIREEVCQEMADQLVEIEQDYNERLEEDKQRAEEVYEKRLEIYAKSVKKPRKRGRTDDDASDSEQVSSSLLAAEQNKVRDRNAQIEKLTADLQSNDQTLKEFEDRLHEEISGLKKTIADQKKSLEEKESTFSSQETTLHEQIETLTATITEQKQRLVEQEKEMSTFEKDQTESKDALQEQISELERMIEDQKKSLAENEAKFSSLEKELMDGKVVLQKQMDELNRTIADQKQSLSEREIENSTHEKEEIDGREASQKQIDELNTVIDVQKDQLFKKTDRIDTLEKELDARKIILAEKVEELTSVIEKQQTELKNQADGMELNTKAMEELSSKISELERMIEDQKKSLAENEAKLSSQEKELMDGKEALQKQVDELNRTIADQKQSLSEREMENSTHEKEEMEGREASQKQIDELNTMIGVQKDQLCKKTDRIDTLEKELEARKIILAEKVEELTSVIEKQQTELKNQADGMELNTKSMEELSSKISELERMIEDQKKSLAENEAKFSSQEKELMDGKEALQKQVDELNRTIADQKQSLSEREIENSTHEKEEMEGREASQKQIETLTATIAEQKQRLVEQEKEMSTLEKEQTGKKDAFQEQISELERMIEDQKKSLAENEAKFSSQEEELMDSKVALQKQIDELNKTIADQKQSLVEREAAMNTNEKEQIEGKEFLQEQIDELNTVIDVQKDQLCKKTDRIDTLEKELDARKIILAEKVKELTSVIEKQHTELKNQAESLEVKTKAMEELTTQQHKDLEEHDALVHDLEERMEVLSAAEKQLADAKKEISEQESQIGDLYKKIGEGEAKVKQTGETMTEQLCAEIKMHEEAQKEMRSTILRNTQNETDSKDLIEEQETSIEELKGIIETKQKQIKELEETVGSKNEEIKEMENKLEAFSQKTPVEETETQTESSSENTTSTSSSSSTEESSDQHRSRKTLSGMPSTSSLASTISSTSTEDDDSIIIIEPEDQVGYKAGRLSRVEIDATPLQKKNSRKGRAAKVTKTSLRSSRKRGGGGDDDEVEDSKKLRGEDGKPKGRSRRATRASSKASLHEEIENQPEDGMSPSTLSQSGSSQRRGPLSRINEYLQNSPIGKSVYDTAKRLVDTATGAASPSAEVVKPPSPSPPKAVEMATFVPSMVPERQRRKRKLYKTDISAPFEASPHEMISRQYVGEAKTTEGAVTVITRKLRSRTRKY